MVDFLRRQLFLIICGVAGALGIGLIVTGLGRMPQVKAEMAKAAEVYNGLSGLQNQPVNDKFIAAAQRRIDTIRGNFRQTLDTARQLQDYEPLLKEVFPAGNTEQRLEFRNRYEAAMRQLMVDLRSGEPATARDIEVVADKIANELYQESLQRGDPSQPPPPDRGPDTTPAGVLTADGARAKAEPRAHIAAAQGILTYAVGLFDGRPPERYPSLDFYAGMKPKATLEAPTLEECWFAQLEYWLQKDVVEAIRGLNEEACAANEGDCWVGVTPVKDVISVRVASGYVTSKPEAAVFPAMPGGYTEARPTGYSDNTLTNNPSTQTYDVVQFTVKLVMDQRDLLRFVDRLCTNRFHTCLRIAYKDVPPNRSMIGKIYGPEPVVNVVMDFETVFLGEHFHRLMPAEVCEKYGVDCPQPEGDAEGSDGEDGSGG